MNITSKNSPLTNPIASFFPEDGLDVKKVLVNLYQHKVLIIAASFLSLFVAFLYTFTIIPQYQTTQLIEIHEQSSNSNVFSKLGYKSGSSSASDKQVALIRSRYVLEPVITENGLNIAVAPHYYPYIGEWMARHHQKNTLANSFFGLKSYAWGGEKIQVKQFIVPTEFVGQQFMLIAGTNNHYQLFSSDGELVLDGQVGVRSTGINESKLSLELATLIAHPGTEFALSYQSPAGMVNGLAHSLKVNSVMGNDPSQSTGIYQLQLVGSNPVQIVKMMRGIMKSTIDKNIEQKSQETQRTLDFLAQRLPELKSNLEKAEDAVNQYHMRTKTLNMGMVSQILLQRLRTTQQAIELLKSQREELLQIYTPEHPLVVANEHKGAELQNQLNKLMSQVKNFPNANQEEINLLREVKIRNTMYLSLLSNKQQLEVVKGGLTEDILPLGEPTPAVMLPTQKLLKLITGFLMGMFLSVLYILIKTAINKTVENSDELEDKLRIPVMSILPFSNRQKQLEKTQQNGLQTFGSALSAPLILSKLEPDDITVESLRSLRVSLHITSPSANHKIFAIMGSLSNIGKSFVALNMSQIIADSGKRTLLIDTDLRKGQLYRSLRKPKSKGLGEYLEGKCQYENIVQFIDENLCFISCGHYTTHPTQLFQSQRFIDLLQKVKHDYDQVIIDMPPIIPVPDSILIAQHCDVKLLVVGAGKETIADLKDAVKKAEAHNIDINGIVLNHRKPMAHYGSRLYYRYGERTPA